MMPLDRRTLLKTSVLTASALATSGVGSATRLGRAVPMKKSLKYGMIKDAAATSVRDKFQLVKDCGFDGVELDSPSDLDESEVLAAKEAVGIEIPGLVDSVHWRENLGSDDAEMRGRGREALEHALRQAKTFGATTVLLVPAVVNEKVSYGQAWKNSLGEIRKVTPLCNELGVRIALENVWNNFLLSPIEAKSYCEATGSPDVGWYLDVGNLLRYGWPEHWIEVLGKERLFKLDVKEFSRKKMNDEGLWKGFDVEIGDGDCGWPRVMSALAAIGWEGWGSAEVGGGDRARLTEIAGRMDRAFGA